MIKSKVIDVLKKFDKNELKELKDFIDSPFHNKNKNIRKLFAALKTFYPSFGNKKLTKEFIYSSILPGKQYADKTMRNLMSDLLELIEEYLAYSTIRENPHFNKYFRTIGISEKGLISLTESSLKEADKMFQDFTFDGGNIFYMMHLNEMEKDFLAIRENKLINLNMKEGEYLVYAFLAKFFIFKMKFFNYQYKLSNEKLSGFMEEFEKSVSLEKFIEYLEKDKSLHSEIILIYFYCTKFMNNLDNDEYYLKVKSLLKKNKNKISRTEIINIYLTLNGYCVAKIRSSNNKYEKELFGLYKEMLEEKLVVGEEETYLHITIFNNIVELGFRTNEFEWTKSFIDEYTDALIPEYRETMKNYSYANYYFRKKEFEKSLHCMNSVNFENYYIKSGVRNLLFKIYFELKYTESFFSLQDSYKHYLANEKMLPIDRREQSLNFIMHTANLYKYYLEPSPEKLKEIETEISKKPAGVSDLWLFEKIEEFKKKLQKN